MDVYNRLNVDVAAGMDTRLCNHARLCIDLRADPSMGSAGELSVLRLGLEVNQGGLVYFLSAQLS